jgi:hypothetical protein
VVLDPFMVGVFKARGVGAISHFDVPAQPAELAKLARALDHLRALRPLAQGARQTLYGGGELYTRDDCGP